MRVATVDDRDRERQRVYELACSLDVLSGGMVRNLASNVARKYQKERESKKSICLNCGKEKYHNNAFCCSECCKEYRNKQRAL